MAFTEFPAFSHVGLQLLGADPGLVNCGLASAVNSILKTRTSSAGKERLCIILARNVETMTGVPSGGCGRVLLRTSAGVLYPSQGCLGVGLVARSVG